MIQTEGITKSFGALQVLKGIDLTINKGEVVAIVGPSGAGKTTLLQIIGTLDAPDSGRLVINGTETRRLGDKELAAFRNRNIGFVFQSYNLLPELTAAENVAMPLMFKGIDPDVRLLEAKKMLCRVGLKDRMDHFPNQMSGGQQQRVGIARAFVTHPEVVFADEPTGNLDPARSLEIMMLLERINQLGTTVLVVTHEKDLVNKFQKRVITLARGIVVSDGIGYNIR